MSNTQINALLASSLFSIPQQVASTNNRSGCCCRCKDVAVDGVRCGESSGNIGSGGSYDEGDEECQHDGSNGTSGCKGERGCSEEDVENVDNTEDDTAKTANFLFLSLTPPPISSDVQDI
uniref:Uncharacterized protein n=1 Tax=Setaria digitata TaxID=48799 RepID=A0A915PS35_9BILA